MKHNVITFPRQSFITLNPLKVIIFVNCDCDLSHLLSRARSISL